MTLTAVDAPQGCIDAPIAVSPTLQRGQIHDWQISVWAAAQAEFRLRTITKEPGFRSYVACPAYETEVSKHI